MSEKLQQSAAMRRLLAKVNFCKDEYPFVKREELKPGDDVEIKTYNEDGQLNHPTGFAFRTPTFCTQYKNGRRHGLHVTAAGSTAYFYEDRRVPSRFFLDPDSVTIKDVVAAKNAEVRYAAAQILGYDKILESEHVTLIEEEKEEPFRKLYHVEGLLRTPYRVVQVYNSTAEPYPGPNGEEPYYKPYFLPVPSSVRTCAEAVAWTFRKEPSTYHPVHET